MYDNGEKIKDLKNKYIEAGKKIARYEAALEEKEKQEAEILRKIYEAGTTEDELDDRIAELSKMYEMTVQQIEASLDPSNPVMNDTIEDDLSIIDDVVEEIQSDETEVDDDFDFSDAIFDDDEEAF